MTFIIHSFHTTKYISFKLIDDVHKNSLNIKIKNLSPGPSTNTLLLHRHHDWKAAGVPGNQLCGDATIRLEVELVDLPGSPQAGQLSFVWELTEHLLNVLSRVNLH